MVKLDEFKIIVTNGDPKKFTLPASGLLEGIVKLTLKEGTHVNYLKIKLKCESVCHFYTGTGDNRHYHHNTEDVLNLKQELIESTDSQPRWIQAGDHSFPFSFRCEANKPWPSSHDTHGHGRIEYKLKAALDQKGDFMDDKTELELEVFNPLNIDGPQYSDPVTKEEEGTKCCLCCASGPIIIKATIDKTGLTPGGWCTIKLEIDNNTGDRLIPSVCLTQEVKLKAPLRNWSNSHELITQPHNNYILPYTKRNECEIKFKVDHENLAPTIDCIQNMFVTYTVLAKINHVDDIEFPVVIGQSSLSPGSVSMDMVQ